MQQPMDPQRLDPQLLEAIAMTQIVRSPQISLQTFGSTVINYHVISPPVYAELFEEQPQEAVVRHGIVKADRPQIVTPGYLTRSEGFGKEAAEYLDYLIQRYGSESTGILYKYKNEPGSTDNISGDPSEVAAKIRDDLDKRKQHLHAVILGIGELWDVSLMKFIYEFTNQSARSNITELESQGLLDNVGGIPRDARIRIEQLFAKAEKGDIHPSELHEELIRWELFEEYQQRFFKLFRP